MRDEKTSKWCGRWCHRTKLVFRVWPRYKKANIAIRTMSRIPITGLYITEQGTMEAWHQVYSTNALRFELQDDDVELLTSIAVSRAEMCGQMVVKAPGTLDERVKKECWMEVPIKVYPEAPPRTGKTWGADTAIPEPKNHFTETPQQAVEQSGLECSKVVLVENDEELDEELLAREVVENDAVIVLAACKSGRGGVSGRRTRELMERAKYWVVPGRKPEEEGGALCGYQFCDRIIRWVRRVDPTHRAENTANRLEVMHAKAREKGKASRRTYFIDELVNRFAKRVGMSRQRVMAKFLDDGMVDVMIRSVDQVKPVLMRETPALLRGRVGEAVNTLEFYYRALEAMAAKRGNGDQGTGNRGGVGRVGQAGQAGLMGRVGLGGLGGNGDGR